MSNVEQCIFCTDLGSFCNSHDFSVAPDSEIVRKFILSAVKPYDDDTLEMAVMYGIRHGRKELQ